VCASHGLVLADHDALRAASLAARSSRALRSALDLLPRPPSLVFSCRFLFPFPRVSSQALGFAVSRSPLPLPLGFGFRHSLNLGLRGRARCVAPRACRCRERCLFEARFGRWPLAWRKIWAVTMFDLAV